MITQLTKSILFIFILTLNTSCGANEEHTKNKDHEWHLNHLSNNLTKITYKKDSIYFESQGNIGVKDKNNYFIQKFTLSKNDEFNLLDKHSSTEYKLIDFDISSLSISYSSKFDHRSFGKNKVSYDSGIIKLQYK